MNPFVASLMPIWNNPRLVFLSDSAIEDTAQVLCQKQMTTPAWKEAVFPQDDSDLFTNFIAVGNSINFAFKDFETKRAFSVKWHDQEWLGAFGMWACLARALEEGHDIADASYLSHITESEMRQMFRGSSPMPLLEERLKIFNEVGIVLEKDYGGKFRNVLSAEDYAAFGSRGIISRITKEFPSFCDQSLHRPTGTLLKFHKRAQLLLMMYQGRALQSTGMRAIVDYEDLGPIADYAVPKALKVAGILEYAPQLEAMINSQELIPKDSEEEQEIRAQTVHAQVKLLDSINRLRSPRITILQLDYQVWSLGRGGKEPHHLTKTTAY